MRRRSSFAATPRMANRVGLMLNPTELDLAMILAADLG
jgi:hypothetical protein